MDLAKGDLGFNDEINIGLCAQVDLIICSFLCYLFMRNYENKKYNGNNGNCRKMHYWKNERIDGGFLFLLSCHYDDNDSSCHISCNWHVIRLETRAPAFNRSLKGHMDKRAA